MKFLLCGVFLLSHVLADIFVQEESIDSSIQTYNPKSAYKRYDLAKIKMNINGKIHTAIWQYQKRKHKKWNPFQTENNQENGGPGKIGAPWKLVCIASQETNYSLNSTKLNIFEYKKEFNYSNGSVMVYNQKLWKLETETIIESNAPKTLSTWKPIATILQGSQTTQINKRNSKKSKQKEEKIQKSAQ